MRKSVIVPSCRERWWHDRLLVFVAAALGVWSAMSFTWPLSGDAGVFAWMADSVWRGNPAYVVAWDTKGPAAWLPSLAMQALTGRNAWAIRLFDIAMVFVALMSLRTVTRRIGEPAAARIAVALYALWYTNLDFETSVQPDGWVGAWLALACALTVAGGGAGAVAAGALVAFSAFSKPFYAGHFVVLWMLIWAMRDLSAAARARSACLVALGGLLLAAAMYAFFSLTGSLDAFLEVQRWNRDVYAGLSGPWLTRIPSSIRGALALPWGLVAPFALFAVTTKFDVRSWRSIAALAVGFIGAVAGVILQGKGWTYHWLPILPYLALLAGIGFARLQLPLAGVTAHQFSRVALGLALAVSAMAPLQQVFRFVLSRRSADAEAVYERREFKLYGRHPGSLYAIVDSLRTLPVPAPSIMVWAMHPAPQIVAGLVIPTRYAVIRPLFDGEGTAIRARYRAEFEREMQAAPPGYWLVPTLEVETRNPEIASRTPPKYAAVDELLRTRYALVAQSADWLVYELRKTPR